MNDYLYDIDSREMLLQWMQRQKGILLCTDEEYSYYLTRILGRHLMYRQHTLRPDGRKCYMLTDSLARCFGFEDLSSMKYPLNTIQYWRRFISVQRLRIAFLRYDGDNEKFRGELEGYDDYC